MNRAIVSIILALVLIAIVMGIAVFMTVANSSGIAKYEANSVWSFNFPDMQSMKIMETADNQRVIFVQNATTLGVLDARGKSTFTKTFAAPLITTLGDVNGDGADDIVAFSPNGVMAMTNQGNALWTVQVKSVGTPYRAAIIRFANSTQIILGDDRGQMIALDPKGTELWRATINITSYIRSLDDVTLNGTKYLAAATQNGYVRMFDASGKTMWTYYLSEALRRVRVYDLKGDGNTELLIGGDTSRLAIVDPATGKDISVAMLGQAITEIRTVEIDGNPTTHEYIAGGKKGGVWAYRGIGETLWSATVPGKVTEISSIDIGTTGTEVAIIGDDGGTVTLFVGKTGQQFELGSHNSGITRIDAGRVTSANQLVVADAYAVQLMTVDKAAAPIFYTPLFVGALISLIIAIAAGIIALIPAKPVLRVSAEDTSIESLEAKRLMLHESLADVERMRQAGEVPGDAYLARLKDLRGDLAETEAALAKAGAKIKPETFKCPNCGGTLQLGVDKCDYCGRVVIT
jgi:hypothetical protein